MLVLSRKLQQQIKIGDQITVTILRVKGNTVRVGIQAPRDLRVLRAELPTTGEEALSVEFTESETLLTIHSEESGDSPDTVDEPGDLQANPVAQGGSERTSTSPTAHLPLRRIRQRHGRGPLQQIIAASSSALAK